MPSGQSTWNYYFVFHLYLPYSFLHIPGSRKHPIRSSTWNYYFVFHLYLSYYYFYIFCFWKLNGGFIITVYLWGSACNYQSSKAPMCFMCWKCTLVSRMYFDPPNSPPLSGMIISQVFQVTRSTSPLLGQLWEHSNREWDKFGFTI